MGGRSPTGSHAEGPPPHGREARSASARTAGKAWALWVGAQALAPRCCKATAIIFSVSSVPLWRSVLYQFPDADET